MARRNEYPELGERERRALANENRGSRERREAAIRARATAARLRKRNSGWGARGRGI